MLFVCLFVSFVASIRASARVWRGLKLIRFTSVGGLEKPDRNSPSAFPALLVSEACSGSPKLVNTHG